MNKILNLGLILFCTIVNAQNGFKISGNLKGFEENALIKIERENIVLDSCYLKNGKFLLNGTFEQSPSSVQLTINNGEDFLYAFLFIGNEDISIDAQIEDFPYSVKTKGSKYDHLSYEHAQLEKDLNIKRKQFLTEMFSIREQGKWNDSLQNAYWGKSEPLGKIRIIDNELEKIRNGFIEKNFNSYYGLYLLGVYKTEIPEAKIANFLKNLSPELQKTAYAKSIGSHLKNPDLKIGEKYHDFSAFDKNGKKTLFSEYFNDKYVLLDFSTVYCGWCLKAIPELEKIGNSQNEKLDIVTFYVDKNEKGFENLIHKHTANWKVLWDREGRLSDTYAKYKVYGTPTFYLFDPNGKLVQMFSGYSEDLSAQIEKAIAP